MHVALRRILAAFLVVSVTGPATVRACFADATWRARHHESMTAGPTVTHACCAAKSAKTAGEMEAPCNRCFQVTVMRDQAGQRSNVAQDACAVAWATMVTTHVPQIFVAAVQRVNGDAGILAPPDDLVGCHVLLTVRSDSEL